MGTRVSGVWCFVGVSSRCPGMGAAHSGPHPARRSLALEERYPALARVPPAAARRCMRLRFSLNETGTPDTVKPFLERACGSGGVEPTHSAFYRHPMLNGLFVLAVLLSQEAPAPQEPDEPEFVSQVPS